MLVTRSNPHSRGRNYTGVIPRSEKAGLKLIMQKTKIMASSPITSWQIDVGKVEAVIEFIFSRIIVDDDCSHEVKR